MSQSPSSGHSSSEGEQECGQGDADLSLARHPLRGEPSVGSGKRAKGSRASLGESHSQPTHEALPLSVLDDGAPSGLGSSRIHRDTGSFSAVSTRVEPSSPSDDEVRPSSSAKHSSSREVEQVDRPRRHRSRGREAKAYPEGRRLVSLVISSSAPSQPHSSQRHGLAGSTHSHKAGPYSDQGMPRAPRPDYFTP